MANNNQHNEKIADKLARKTINRDGNRCIDGNGSIVGNGVGDQGTCESLGGQWVSGFSNLDQYQKIIKDGNIVSGRESDSDRIVMYESDLLAHGEDIDAIIGGNITDANLDGSLNDLEVSNTMSSPENVSQFVDFDPSQLSIDTDLADEILDTNITELLPDQSNRQSEIDDLFDEFNRLIGSTPDFIETESGELELDPFSEWSDISINPPDPNASVTRLQSNEDEYNQNQSIESMRQTLNNYLQDIDSDPDIESSDERPIYEDNSSGFVKIRGLNQSILIKQEEGQELSMAKLIPDPNNGGILTPRYLVEGFTITMWVRFKDKVNSGTLFNFGNPTRDLNPHGFKLETFVLERGDIGVPVNFEFENGVIPFSQETHERFVRLVVREDESTLRDSHTGLPYNPRIEGIAADSTLYNCTRIPIDLDEWYFIVANYNPNISEDTSFDLSDGSIGSVTTIPEFWRWNVTNTLNQYIHYSSLGAKCKVEIISKSDLIRARGFRQK
jgi:hypothetical protein